jgi:branched-chain amino acid transport system ATP-binding protein
MNLLQLQDVHTHIGKYHILHGVDLEVEQGRIGVLLGRNGAGKSTTLRTIMGLWRASSGSVRFDAQDITRRSTPDIARGGIGYVPEDMGIFSTLKVRENMLLAARSGPMDESRLEWIFGLFPALKRFWDTPAGALSGGQKQMLAIGRALIEPRRLLLIDEPTKGLAPAVIQHMIDALLELKRNAITVLLVEQNFHFARSLGDTVHILDDGKVVHRASMAELVDDEATQRRHLGLGLGAHQ